MDKSEKMAFSVEEAAMRASSGETDLRGYPQQ